MDLGVIGRHALLFDDDDSAAFVNSGNALVEWHSLQIDRYDVRHLLSVPPPPRRRNRNSESTVFEDPLLESQLDHERYIDLPVHSEIRDDETANEGVYSAVGFTYGENDDLTDQKKKDSGTDFSGFLPPFPIPQNILQSLPPTEKVHQIIARTAMFVSKHGGQSEIVLRVKQGDNPTFGFLMPDHQLHSYFRFLVEHPEILLSHHDMKSQDEVKNIDSKRCNTNDVGGALSLLGSVYESGEEEDGDNDAKNRNNVSEDRNNIVSHSISRSSSKMESNLDVMDMSISTNTVASKNWENAENLNNVSMRVNKVPSVKEKVLSGKNISSISSSKSGGVKRKSCSTMEMAKSSAFEVPAKIESVILEPPPEFKSLIDKLVELITRNGKQFEENLIEQDKKHGKFPFLSPSDQYHPYYVEVLQTAQGLKTNGKYFHSQRDDMVGHGNDRKASVPKNNVSSLLDSNAGDMPLESDIKEKFKMFIGKSKKELSEAHPKEKQLECGVAVDAAAAAAILQSAIRGVKSNLEITSNTPRNSHSQMQNDDQNRSSRTSPEAAHVAEDVSTEEQKLKAERLKKAKMFVAMLKNGMVPSKDGTMRGSSVDPPESGVTISTSEANLAIKQIDGSLAAAAVANPVTVEKPEKILFGEEHNERLARRRYRLRPRGCENDAEDTDGDEKKHTEGCSSAMHKSRSRKRADIDESENKEGIEQKHYRRRRLSHSSSEDSDAEVRKHKRHRRRKHFYSSSEESEIECETYGNDRDRKLSRPRRHSSHSRHEDGEREYKDKAERLHKRSRKKHQSHHLSQKRRHSSEQCSDKEDEHCDDDGRDGKRSRKKHRNHRTSENNGNLHKHRNRHPYRDEESAGHLPLSDERCDLEEGEISSTASEKPRGIVSGLISQETSLDASGSHRREPSETIVEVPEDLRAKIRAMLMITRL